MTIYIALLRAVNVGGTGKLPMTELKAMCEALAFTQVKTYIASGNVVFNSPHPAHKTCALLEQSLQLYAGKAVGVFLRTPEQLAQVLEHNPYQQYAPNRSVAIFIDETPNDAMIAAAKGRKEELIALGTQEIYVYYGDGMADSKLVIPAAKLGTARNMNTIAKLAELGLQAMLA
ncbi:MAG: DUF1697 domain-containing protein [Undibacterium sp.]|nr:DUF1697 domain-containing protein [Undibacterium sp.]